MTDEKQLERQCRAYARARGCIAIKIEKNGHKGIPDDLFILPPDVFFFVEFKRPQGGIISDEQKIWAQKLPEKVFICHDFDHFKTIFNIFAKTQSVDFQDVKNVNKS